MPNNKLKDNEIIKTLQEMADYPHNYEEGQDLQNALDLINRQKAEIERLKAKVNHYDYLHNVFVNTPTNRIKSEARKEFAERLKEKPCADKDVQYLFDLRIDNLLKEMERADNV